MAKKTKKPEFMSWDLINKLKSVHFERVMTAYNRTSPMGLDELVSHKGVKKHLYRLVDLVDDIIIDDYKNNIKVSAYIERYAYNERTHQGLAKIVVQHEIDDGDDKAHATVETSCYRRVYDICSDGKKLSPIELFDDLFEQAWCAARNVYYDQIRNMYGSEVMNCYD